MHFQMDTQGDVRNGVKTYVQVCTDLNVPVPANVVEQTEAGYCFEFHTGTHGDPVIYVNHTKTSDRKKRDVPAIKLTDPPTWQRGKDEFKSKEQKDALRVVQQNLALFLALYNAWNT